MSAGEAAALSRGVFETFQKQLDELFPEDAFDRSRSVALYFPIRGEVDTRFFFTYFRKAGRTCFFPKVFPETADAAARIEFHPVRDWSELRLGRYGIAEPHPLPGAAHAVPELIFVPGIVFDENGHRLGYGAGYYDRALAEIKQSPRRPRLVGLAYDFQIVPALPSQPHDIAVDAVISEKRVILPAKHRSHFSLG